MTNRRDLSRAEHRAKERILTQSDPANLRTTREAVVLKDGAVFLLTDEGGDVPWGLPHGYGLFLDDCRFLDGLELTLNGQRCTVLSGTGLRGFETRHRLTNESAGQGRGAMSKNTIAIDRRRLIRGGVVHEIQTIHNYGRRRVRLRLRLRFRSRFEDLYIVKRFVREPRGQLRPPAIHDDHRIELGYDGKDGAVRTTTFVFAPPPARLRSDQAEFLLELAPGETEEIALTITPSVRGAHAAPRDSAHPRTTPAALRAWLERSEAIWLRKSATVRSDLPLFDRVLRRALLDLHLLRSHLAGHDYFAAGVPWFVTLFGRDAATVALQTLPYSQDVARQTLVLLARYQATEHDRYRDAEPGKILHEFRSGELAALQAIPQSPAYYGSVDATLLFLILAAEYVRWSGDLELTRRLRPNIDAALRWSEGPADSDGDGYLDYVGRYPNGVVNQGWKDSGNAIVNTDGALAEPPIALCEVQGYAYRAWRDMAALMRQLGDMAAAERLERRAADLRARFDADFWSPQLDCYVLARQKGGRPAAVVSSNAGQVLWTGIARPERAARVVQRLMGPEMFGGWGIRTLAADARAFNPMSYHLGSVWPHDNALILAGFRRYGHDEAALSVFDALYAAAQRFRDYRLPELFAGYPRSESEAEPVRYPVACSPQAWAAGALPHALWMLFGLRADAGARVLYVCRPRLPHGLTDVELTEIKIGGARVDLRLRRASDDTVELSHAVRAGDIRVERRDTPEDDDG